MSYLVVCGVAVVAAGLTLFSGFGLGTLLLPAFALFFPLEVGWLRPPSCTSRTTSSSSCSAPRSPASRCSRSRSGRKRSASAAAGPPWAAQSLPGPVRGAVVRGDLGRRAPRAPGPGLGRGPPACDSHLLRRAADGRGRSAALRPEVRRRAGDLRDRGRDPRGAGQTLPRAGPGWHPAAHDSSSQSSVGALLQSRASQARISSSVSGRLWITTIRSLATGYTLGRKHAM